MTVYAATTPLVSVVVPTHNRPDMLAQALASIRAQTYPDYEIVVISNGEGPDMRRASGAVAATFNAIYLELPEGNLPAARNYGIEHAKGEWIALLDDDDWWLPTKLERQVEAARRSGADMVTCDYVEIWNDGHEVVLRPRIPIQGWSYAKAISHGYWWMATGATLIRKSVYESVGGFDARMRYSEDNDTWRRISWRHSIHQTDDVLFCYRRGHQSMMSRERTRYLYDLRHFFKMHFDTPSDLRSALPGGNYFWNRAAIICFPSALTRKLELTPWGGPQWSRLIPVRVLAFYHWLRGPHSWLRPRTRWMSFRGWLRPRTRLKQFWERWSKRKYRAYATNVNACPRSEQSRPNPPLNQQA